jgi:hypothetical protein
MQISVINQTVNTSERVIAPLEHGGVSKQPDEVLLVRQERRPARTIALRVIAPCVAAAVVAVSPLTPGRPGRAGVQEHKPLRAVALAPPDEPRTPPEDRTSGAALPAARRGRRGQPPG